MNLQTRPPITYGPYMLDDVIRDPSGIDIPCTCVPCEDPSKTALLFMLKAGSSFRVNQHPIPVEVLFLEGFGEFVYGGTEIVYMNRCSFLLKPFMRHQFKNVFTDTFVVKVY